MVSAWIMWETGFVVELSVARLPELTSYSRPSAPFMKEGAAVAWAWAAAGLGSLST